MATIILAFGVLIASWAETFAVFIAGRIVTGIGAAGILTVSMIIVLELAGPKQRGIMMGLLNSGFTVGVALGATFAGALLPKVGWRALFWMQAPISVVAGTILLFAIPHDFTTGKKQDPSHSILTRLATLDYLGAVTLVCFPVLVHKRPHLPDTDTIRQTASIVLALFSLSSPQGIPIYPLVLSVFVLITFIGTEAYVARDPIVPVSLLKSRGLLFTCLGTVGYMMARWSVLFFSPTYALAVRNWPPAAAGSILIATNGGFGIGGIVVGWLHIRRHGSFYIPSIITYALFPVTLLGLALTATAASSATLYIFLLFVNGFVTGAAINYTLAHVLHLTPKETHYIATSLLATFRGFAGSFGSAVGGGLFTRLLRSSLVAGFKEAGVEGKKELVRRLLGSPALVGQLSGVDRVIAVRGYEDALKGLWMAGAGLAVIMVFIQASTGWVGVEERLDDEDERLVEENEREE